MSESAEGARLDEDDADRFGLRYLVDAGYNPKGLGGAFEVLRSQDWGGGSAMPAYLSTHPDLNIRLAKLRADIQSMPANLTNRREDDGRFRLRGLGPADPLRGASLGIPQG